MKLIDGKMLLEDDDIGQNITRACKCPKYPGAVITVDFEGKCVVCGGVPEIAAPKPCHETEHEKKTVKVRVMEEFLSMKIEGGTHFYIELEADQPCSDPNGCRMEGVVRVKR
jgi:hypothetical protein